MTGQTGVVTEGDLLFHRFASTGSNRASRVNSSPRFARAIASRICSGSWRSMSSLNPVIGRGVMVVARVRVRT